MGRDRRSVEISAMWIPQVEGAEAVSRYAELGVSRLVVPLPALAAGKDPVDGIERFGTEMLAKL